MPFDFHFYPLIHPVGLERDQIPEMPVIAAPNKAHRHRKDDLVALYINLEEKGDINREEFQELTESACRVFFQTEGSVTRAIQAACDEVNRNLLERNLRSANDGVSSCGSYNMAVLHNGWLFFGQYGSTAAYVITEESFQKFGGNQEIEERLGLSKHIQVRYYQSEVEDNDILLMSADPPKTWNAYNLSGSTRITVEQLYRRLMNQVAADFRAIVIRVKAGSGNVVKSTWADRPRPESPDIVFSDKVPEHPGGTIPINIESGFSAEIDEEPLSDSHREKPEKEINKFTADDELVDMQQEEVAVIAGETERRNEKESDWADAGINLPEKNNLVYLVARFWMRGKTARAKIRRFLDKAIRRFVPQKLQDFSLKPFILTVFAIGIPAVLVLFSLTVYSRTGKSQEYERLMADANQAAEKARNEENSGQIYEYFSQTIELVKQAEEYRITQDSRMLYEQAQFLLDEMDLAARLEFRPALTDFMAEEVVISRIESSSSGVYLLDESSGSILRIFLNSKGFYELDEEFVCAPGPYGLENVSALIDLVVLPANSESYRVMAVDSTGNLLYCRPGETPDSRTLPAPDGGWGEIAGIDLDGSLLLVMDAEKDAIWIYSGKDPDRIDVEGATGIVFSESPSPFFNEEPPDLAGALDMVSNDEDLYLLHQDGHMTLCRYAPIKEIDSTECQDPAPYTDNRIGRENKNPWLFMDAQFSMMEEARLPNAAIYVLDNAGPSIYQFSFQLNLEKTLKPQQNKNYPLPDTDPSGIGITSDMDIFLAFDNRLYIAPLNP